MNTMTQVILQAVYLLKFFFLFIILILIFLIIYSSKVSGRPGHIPQQIHTHKFLNQSCVIQPTGAESKHVHTTKPTDRRIMTSSCSSVSLFTWQKPESFSGFVSHISWCHTWVTGIIKMTYGKNIPTRFFFFSLFFFFLSFLCLYGLARLINVQQNNKSTYISANSDWPLWSLEYGLRPVSVNMGFSIVGRAE